MNPEDFWSPSEGQAGSFAEAAELVQTISDADLGRRFAWRGVTNATWALHSSLPGTTRRAAACPAEND